MIKSVKILKAQGYKVGKEENHLTFHDIVNEIHLLSPVRILSASSGEDISRVKLWANRPESEKDTILYFGYDTQPESWPDHYILAFDQHRL